MIFHRLPAGARTGKSVGYGTDHLQNKKKNRAYVKLSIPSVLQKGHLKTV